MTNKQAKTERMTFIAAPSDEKEPDLFRESGSVPLTPLRTDAS